MPSLPQPPYAGHLLDPRNIEDLLNYRLYSLLAFSGAAVIRLCEGKYGISRREWHVLALLAKYESLTPSAIADMTHLDRARVSRAITQLRKKNLILRDRCPGDQRRADVRLTPHGQDLYQHLFAETSRLNVELTSAIDPAFLAEFDATLERLLERAKVLSRETAPGVQADRWKGVQQRRPWAGGDGA